MEPDLPKFTEPRLDSYPMVRLFLAAMGFLLPYGILALHPAAGTLITMLPRTSVRKSTANDILELFFIGSINIYADYDNHD